MRNLHLRLTTCFKFQRLLGLVVFALSFGNLFFAGTSAEAASTPHARQPHVKAKSSVSGSRKFSSFTRVVSFDELMRLSIKKRVAYIRGLRVLFKDLEQQRVRGASAAVLEQHKFIAALLNLYDQTLSRAEAAAQPAEGSLVWTGVAKTCSGNYQLYRIFKGGGTARPSTHVCVSQKESQTEPCKGNLIPIEQDNEGKFHCATPASFYRLSGGDQRSARTSSYIPNGFVPGLRRPGFLAKVLGPGLKQYFEETGPSLNSLVAKDEALFQKRQAVAKAAAAPVQAPRANSNSSQSADRGDAIRIQQKAAPANATSAGKAPNPWYSGDKPGLYEGPENCPVMGENYESIDQVPAEYAASVRARCAAFAQNKPLPPVRKAAVAKPNRNANSRTAAPTKAVTLRSQNPLPQNERDATQISDARRSATARSHGAQAPALGTATALSAGPADVSEAQDSSSAQPAAAAATTEAPTLDQCDADAVQTCDASAIEEARQKYASDSNPDCIYAGAVVGYERGVKQSFKCEPPRSFCFGSSNCRSDAGESMTPAYTCGSKSVICNPLLFGVKSDGKTPFCISRDANATISCEAVAAEEPNAVQPLDENHAGIREAWNNFAERLNQLCQGNETSKILHCEECNVIRSRLFALNVAARSATSCGAAQKFEETKCQDDGSCSGRPGVKSAPAAASGSSSGSSASTTEPTSPSPERVPATAD